MLEATNQRRISPPPWGNQNRLLEPSWAVPGRSWGRLGGASWAPYWASLGVILGPPSGLRSASGAKRREGKNP
eukprot:8915176-Pyramimonas_sp.AAC.1